MLSLGCLRPSILVVRHSPDKEDAATHTSHMAGLFRRISFGDIGRSSNQRCFVPLPPYHEFVVDELLVLSYLQLKTILLRMSEKADRLRGSSAHARFHNFLEPGPQTKCFCSTFQMKPSALQVLTHNMNLHLIRVLLCILQLNPQMARLEWTPSRNLDRCLKVKTKTESGQNPSSSN